MEATRDQDLRKNVLVVLKNGNSEILEACVKLLFERTIFHQNFPFFDYGCILDAFKKIVDLYLSLEFKNCIGDSIIPIINHYDEYKKKIKKSIIDLMLEVHHRKWVNDSLEYQNILNEFSSICQIFGLKPKVNNSFNSFKLQQNQIMNNLLDTECANPIHQLEEFQRIHKDKLKEIEILLNSTAVLNFHSKDNSMKLKDYSESIKEMIFLLIYYGKIKNITEGFYLFDTLRNNNFQDRKDFCNKVRIIFNRLGLMTTLFYDNKDYDNHIRVAPKWYYELNWNHHPNSQKEIIISKGDEVFAFMYLIFQLNIEKTLKEQILEKIKSYIRKNGLQVSSEKILFDANYFIRRDRKSVV